jgi:SsrA-binding protein
MRHEGEVEVGQVNTGCEGFECEKYSQSRSESQTTFTRVQSGFFNDNTGVELIFHFNLAILSTEFFTQAPMATQEENGEKTVVTNRKARHEFTILETYEAGLVLTGNEVKSVRQGQANISEGYAIVKNGEVWLVGMHISPYKEGSYTNVDPLRTRKLLLHKSEIRKLFGRVSQKGFSLVPLRVYFKKNLAKILLAVAQGKKSYDKRQDIAKREAERSMRQRHAR